MPPLVACIPNFSEGRSPEVVAAIAQAVRSVPDVYLLDQTMDRDHHRSVLTFVGTGPAVAAAAVAAAREATARIDLRRHDGVHPRIGAIDVLPFVPVHETTMQDCIDLARGVGERLGRELNLPVFLYERAATRPVRVNLEAIRRGGLDGLSRRMASDPDWLPDFGPTQLHPTAGATAVGARPPLIAFNVNLDTPDIAVAKAIAEAVRFSNGGLPAVKAIGVELKSRGLVQVSMNLTNTDITPLSVAFDAVETEARRRGIVIMESELIGLPPAAAMAAVDRQRMKLTGFDASHILEARLASVMMDVASR
ncbi:MAG TPA: glutamate formimidoyltransferase [Nitrospirales bacterium]|nr:glutamate formimidoyltransferase [Nitrospirales bacterium]